LLEPVAVGIRDDLSPALHRRDACDAAEGTDALKLLLTRQVIADVVEQNSRRPLGCRILDEYGDRNRCTAADAEHVVFFFAPLFTGRSGIASKMKDINGAELFLQAPA